MATDIQTNQATLVNEPGLLPIELRPSVEHLTADSIFSDKQKRLLTEPLYASWNPSTPFLASANVGLFYSVRLPPYVPDVLLSLNAYAPENLFRKTNRSYFTWEYGKSPDAVFELVCNRDGKEETEKLLGYARIGIPFYVIYDPEQWLGSEKLKFYELHGSQYKLKQSSTHLMPLIGLGITLWNGSFERQSDQWLRWTDLEGNLIATGAERAEREQQRADAEKQRADADRHRVEKLTKQLRRLGVEPEDLPH